MTDAISRRVLNFVEDELQRGLGGPVSIEDDLVQCVDWERLHPDERIPSFICDFCNEFKVEGPSWPKYREMRSGIMGLLNPFFKGGPDDQYFLSLDFPSIPMQALIEMASSKQWRYPFSTPQNPKNV
ncbi:hypothetical protein [uncultured Litoreibacter sp.]|uniref:hypothetical protein n=1 Tax=uncultured Litoreibacter sp. TaxID=1392394 RepID=UPI002618474C|nr:hypothetical protein [uncultured Litoreibacter sp.]